MASSGEQEATTVVLARIKRKQNKESLHKFDRPLDLANSTNNGETLQNNNQIVNVRIKIEDESANSLDLMDTSDILNTSICKTELPSVSTVVIKNGADDNNAVDRNILNNMKVEIPAELEDQLHTELEGSNHIKTESNRTYTCEMCQARYTEKETWRSHCSICTGLPQNDDGIRIAIREIPDHRIRLTSSGDRQEPGTSADSTPNAFRGAWESRGRTDRTRRALTKRKELYQKNLTRSLDSFFSAMCESTKNLPAYAQLQIKRKVFDIIKEAEESTLCMNMNGCDTTDDEAP